MKNLKKIFYEKKLKIEGVGKSFKNIDEINQYIIDKKLTTNIDSINNTFKIIEITERIFELKNPNEDSITNNVKLKFINDFYNKLRDFVKNNPDEIYICCDYLIKHIINNYLNSITENSDVDTKFIDFNEQLKSIKMLYESEQFNKYELLLRLLKALNLLISIDESFLDNVKLIDVTTDFKPCNGIGIELSIFGRVIYLLYRYYDSNFVINDKPFIGRNVNLRNVKILSEERIKWIDN